LGFALLAVAFFGTVLLSGDVWAAKGRQKGFSSPDEAVAALVSAVRKSDVKEIISLFGPGGKALVLSGDRVADRKGREWFVKAFDEKAGL
jgi:uncharacterized membrane protein YvbJ